MSIVASTRRRMNSRSRSRVLAGACMEALEPRMLLSAASLFQPAVSYTTGYQPCAVAVGDFNHDGKADMVTVNASSTQDPGSMSLLLGKGDGTFEDAVSIPTHIDPSAVVVGRFNNDAYDDIAVTCYDSGSGGAVSVVDIFLGNSSGSFQTMTSFATPDSPVSLALADFNGDHHPDLAVSSHKGADDLNLSVYLGDGAGGFALQSSYVSYWNWALTSGDFNEDGTVDLAVTSLASSQDNYSVTIYTGNGDGTFAAHATGCTIDDGPTAITATDLNGDGHLDLAVTSQNVQTTGLGILQGAGDGTFAGPANFSALGLADGLAAADFDNDGHMDLAIAQGGDDSLRLKLGNGAGAFRDIGDEEISVGGGPQGVAIADFNGDRLNDVAVTDQSGTSVSVLLGAGPIVSDLAFMLNRNATFTFSKTVFTNVYTDTNHLNLSGVKIMTLPAHGTLKLKGVAVTAGQVIPVAQVGTLTYVINTAYDGTDTFTWRAFDGVSYSGLATVRFVTTPEATITGGGTVQEGQPGASTTFTVLFNHASLASVDINLTSGGHAVGGKNYVKLPTKVTIPAGATSATVTLTPLVDGVAKGDLDVLEKLAAGTGYTVETANSATALIIDDDPILSIAATDATAAETVTGQTPDTGTFTIYRKTSAGAPATTGNLSVLLIRSGTAKFGPTGEYTLSASGDPLTTTTVVIPNGQDHIDIRLNPIDDFVTEPTKTAALALGKSTAYRLSTTPANLKATVSIADNEPYLSIVATDATAAETLPGQTLDTGTISIYRKTAAGAAITAGTVTVKFTLAGTAKFGPTADYTLSVGGVPLTTTSVTIPDGQDHVDILLSPRDDSVIQPTQTAIMTLAKDAAYWLPTAAADTKATVSIADDTPAISAAVTDAVSSRAGNDTGAFQLTRSGYAGNSLTVTINLAGTAKNGVDYNNVPLTATFAPNSSTADIVITPKPDNGIPLPTKSVQMKLQTGPNYKIGTTTAQQASVQDNLALADYFPTGAGKNWHYSGMAGSKVFDAYRIIGITKIINGLTTTQMYTTAAGKTIATDYILVDSDGLKYAESTYSANSGTETQTYNPAILTLPATFQLGSTSTGQTTYTSTRTTNGGATYTGTGTRTTTVAPKTQKVTVPFRTYDNAFHITIVDTWTDNDGWHGTTTKNYWLANGVGVIKVDVSATSSDAQNQHSQSSSYSASLVDWST